MSWWERIAEWIGGGPAVVPNVAAMDDARLTTLWSERDQLTDEARAAVERECIARGLKLRGLASSTSPSTSTSSSKSTSTSRLPSGPRASGAVIDVRTGVGVLLQTIPGRWLLVLLPRWSVTAPDMPADLPVDALVIANHVRHGWLDGSAWARHLGLDDANVYATDEGAIDRAPGLEGGRAQRMPELLERGSLTLKPFAAVPGVLRATWNGAVATATIGAAMPAGVLSAPPGSRAYVGSLPTPGADVAWSALLTAAHAAAMLTTLHPTTQSEAVSVLLLGDAVGAPLRSHTHLLAGFGIQIVGAECPVMPESVDLLGAVTTGRWDLVAASQDAISWVEDVMEHLVVERRDADARRLADTLADARPTDATAQRLRGTAQALAGHHDDALATLAAAEADRFSLIVASAVHVAKGDLEAAEGSARRALQAMPRDTDAMAALVRALWWAGRDDDAKKIVDDAPSFTLRGTEASDLYELIASARPTERPTRVVLPHLAKRAIRIARATHDRARAEAAAARAAELDPAAFGAEPASD